MLVHEFQPIELAWGTMKRWLASHNDHRTTGTSLVRMQELVTQAALSDGEILGRRQWEGWVRNCERKAEEAGRLDLRVDAAEAAGLVVAVDIDSGDDGESDFD